MKKITFTLSVVMLACLVSLSACSGGGGASLLVSSAGTPDSPISHPALVLPPMPDRSVNNSTLAGVSTTGTGVRDDVYRYIFSTYTSTHKRAALMQNARSLRNIYLKPPSTTPQALVLAKEIHEAMHCLWWQRDSGHFTRKEALHADRRLEAMHSDTKARMLAYDKYNALLDGTGSPLPSSYRGFCLEGPN